MEERAKIPVTLPREGPTQPFWQDPPADIADLRSTADLPESADVIIIGSGITGAAVAWHLLTDGTPPASVLMLEARQTCSGATGRNGGHTKAASYRFFGGHAADLGTEGAVQIARLELANIRATHAFAMEHGIECDLNPCQTVDIMYDETQWNEAHEAVAAMREAMPGEAESEYEFYTKDEVKQRFHCGAGGEENVIGGVGYFAGSISAYRFVIGVLKLCLEKGLNLQTHTAAVALDRRGDGKWEVKTERGIVVATRVILATNAYTAALAKQFQGSIVPLRGQITMHRAGKSMPQDGLATTYTFNYAHGYEYMVSRPKGSTCEGDLVIGGGYIAAEEGGVSEYGTTDDTTTNDKMSKYLEDAAPRYFGIGWGEDNSDGRVRREWSGIMGYTPDGRPFVGEVPKAPGLWLSCGFVGHGMVYCWMCARALVEMLRGRGGPQWFPAAFEVSEARMQQSFQGRSHASTTKAE